MGNVYASADWHGCGTIADKVLNELKSDDKLYFLGDAIDRGKDGIYILEKLLNDPRVAFIKGNHEELMQQAVPCLMSGDFHRSGDFDIDDWFSNGGSETWDTLCKMPNDKINKIIKRVRHLPLELTYKSPLGHTVIMEHAGYTPFVPVHRYHDPLWDRDHFLDSWTYNDPMTKEEKNTYLVHGHTPVQYLKFFYGYDGQKPMTLKEMNEKQAFRKGDFNVWTPRIIRYCDGHKLDIDMCTIATNTIALLNLDTFEKTYYIGEDND